MAERFLSKATTFVQNHQDQPFFLYYAPHDIHVPHAPNPRFVHTSACGIRGDSIEELDAVVGEFMNTLQRLNLNRKTLVIFSSDNGPIFSDGYADGSIEEANGHKPAGPYRGGKYQIYEGGTRVPFIVSWPGKVAPGVSSGLVNQVDLFASLADLSGSLSGATRPDSQDLLKTLLGSDSQGRATMVEQSTNGWMALREGPWKVIFPGKAKKKKMPLEEGDVSEGPAPILEVQLYNLDSDPGETKNIAADHPDIVQKMTAEYQTIHHE